jgi:hypothetical protein
MPNRSMCFRPWWTLAGTLCCLAGCDRPPAFSDASRLDSAQDVADVPDVPDAPDERADVPLQPDADADAGLASMRPIFPPSTSMVTSRRPRLRWEQTSSAQLVVEVCADRACTRVLETLSGYRTAQPTRDLPPGVVFWRVRDVFEGSPIGEPSATWQFTVPHRSAPIDTASGSVLDVNGDGLGDFTTRFNVPPVESLLQLYYGASDGMITTPGTVLTGPETWPNEGEVASGDVNGDGFGDLLFSDYSPVRHRGVVRVYFGGPAGISSTPDLTLAPLEEHETDYFGFYVAAGDVDGDGFTDVLASCTAHLPSYRDSYPAIAVFKGGPDGPSPTPTAFVAVPVPAGTGWKVHLVGSRDVDGDGYADAVLLSRGPDGLYLFRGGSGGLSSTPEAIELPAAVGIGIRPRFVGDVNGDGYSDLAALLTVDGAAEMRLLYGGARGPGILPLSTMPWRDDGEFEIRTLPEAAGDVNGDGYDDVLYGTPDAERGGMAYGAAHVHFGGPDGLAVEPGLSFFGNQRQGLYGCGVAGGGRDLNGDGFADFLVGACSLPRDVLPQDSGSVYLYFGGDGAVPSAVRIVSRPPGQRNGYWGWLLALHARNPLDQPVEFPFGVQLLQPASSLWQFPPRG